MGHELMVGAAEAAITPPVGTSLAGYFHDRVSTAVQDDLFAKALVVERDGTEMAVVACDLICISGELGHRARARIEERAGISATSTLVCATHIHTGPDTRRSRVVPRNEQWFATLPDRIAEAVCDARAAKRPATLYAGRAEERGLAFNRRFRLADGTETFGTGRGAVVGVAGPTDPELQVLAFASEVGEPFAVVSNYALHIDVMGGTAISADYPGVMTEVLRGVYGEGLVHLFLNGACGNINHVPYLVGSHVPNKGPVKVRQIGRALAGAVVNAAEKASPSESCEVGVAREMVAIPYYPKDERVLEMLLAAQRGAEPSERERHFVERVESYDRDGETAPVEVQALRLGDAAVVGVPGEYFVEWGLEIKRWSPMVFTLVAELANDWFGYIPTWEALARGGYEATPILSSQLAPGAGQQIADAAFRLLRGLNGHGQAGGPSVSG
ncbi:MAG: hypothetical protein ACODAJ_04755 [Planctomycetota bacterium]